MSWACSYRPIVFLLTCLSILEFGIAEKVKLKVSLHRQQDGHVLSSIFIGNGTRRTTNNLSLQLDLDAVMDNSGKLIGVQGFVRDTERNNSVELSTCNDTFKDEEIKGIWSIFCPEKGEKLLDILPRTSWGGKENVDRQRKSQTADLLIVDGLTYMAPMDDYNEYMRILDSKQMKYLGDYACNFWISDDGKVFEGIGWDYYNLVSNGGLGPRSLIIGFIKKERNAVPSAAAIKAFKELVRSAICLRKLSLHYNLVPFYLVVDYYSIGKYSFERKEMRTWYSYKDNLDFLVPLERNKELSPQIIPKEELNCTKQQRDLMALSSPIEYIVVAQYYGRCFFNCTDFLKLMQRNPSVRNKCLPFNFIVAEDGRVHEVTGWGKTWYEHYQRKKTIEVRFLGTFDNYGPSKPIFLAFNDLIQDGLRSGKLSANYQIVTMNSTDPKQSVHTGNFLEKEIRKLDRYTDKY